MTQTPLAPDVQRTLPIEYPCQPTSLKHPPNIPILARSGQVPRVRVNEVDGDVTKFDATGFDVKIAQGGVLLDDFDEGSALGSNHLHLVGELVKERVAIRVR